MVVSITRDEFAVLRPILDKLVAGFRPEQIWLFGSRAEGRARADSDWDLLVVLPDDSPRGFLEPAVVWSAVHDPRVPLDVVPCTRREFEQEKTEIDSLPRAAFERGRLLYART